MDRRGFLGTVALAALAAPRLGEAWPAVTHRVPRVGVLGETNPLAWTVRTPVVDLECRWADDQRESLAELASQLVALEVDAIVAVGAAAAHAAGRRTARVPIVVVAEGDIGEDAVVARLAGSARNMTWLSVPSEAGMAQQRLSLLSRVVPRLRRVAVLSNPDTVANVRALARLSAGALDAGADVHSMPARVIDDVEHAFVAMARDGVDGLLVLADTLFAIHAGRLAELAAEAGTPAVYGARVFVESGGLMALHGDIGDTIQRTAAIVGQILAGTPPAALLPPPQPKPQIALNLATAARLGLGFPPALLAQAVTIDTGLREREITARLASRDS